MKIFTGIAILMSLTYSTFCQTQKVQICITHLTGNFYVHTSYKLLNNSFYPSNGLLVIADSGVILIDTPWDEDQTIKLVETIKEKFHKNIIFCVVTHSHDDRTAGLDVLKKMGVKTYSNVSSI